MATPLIAAEIADLESANTGLSSYQIVQDVMQSASPLGSGSSSSAGATSSQGVSQLIQALGGMSPLGSGQINLSSLALHATSPSALVAAH